MFTFLNYNVRGILSCNCLILSAWIQTYNKTAGMSLKTKRKKFLGLLESPISQLRLQLTFQPLINSAHNSLASLLSSAVLQCCILLYSHIF